MTLGRIKSRVGAAMSKEVTIIYRDGSSVGLGMLETTARRYHHILLVKDSLQGGTSLAEDATLIPIDDVDLYDGYEYQALIDFQDRNRALLIWRGARQVAEKEFRAKAMEGVERQVSKNLKGWDKGSPEPSSGWTVASELLGTAGQNCGCLELEEKGHDSACKLYVDPHDAMDADAAHAHHDHWPSHEHHDGKIHIGKPSAVMAADGPGAADVAVVDTEPEPILLVQDRCASLYGQYQCDLNDGHDGQHTVTVNDSPWQWPDTESRSTPEEFDETIAGFDKALGPPPEETEETAPSETKCKSMMGDFLCVLPADHNEMHSNTTDPTNGEAPRWSDEEQDGEMPF